ncbi:hypothetical protein [Streptomyces kanamyceticus]|uniref:hypothetical protein n=1 Tax=Streptomyces kanamyceticus TaxID=1967 RepID=UPI0012FF47EB|nr:hypothetical protein [Streptomyces kanamyceticus]
MDPRRGGRYVDETDGETGDDTKTANVAASTTPAEVMTPPVLVSPSSAPRL